MASVSNEAPKAQRGMECGEGLSPPWGGGLGGGIAPSSEFFFRF